MMTAKVETAIVNITCPKCDKGQENHATNSYDWTREDITRANGGTGVLDCNDCGTTFRLPVNAKY
jgi:transcription elongation factor Elf1